MLLERENLEYFNFFKIYGEKANTLKKIFFEVYDKKANTLKKLFNFFSKYKFRKLESFFDGNLKGHSFFNLHTILHTILLTI